LVSPSNSITRSSLLLGICVSVYYTTNTLYEWGGGKVGGRLGQGPVSSAEERLPRRDQPKVGEGLAPSRVGGGAESRDDRAFPPPAPPASCLPFPGLKSWAGCPCRGLAQSGCGGSHDRSFGSGLRRLGSVAGAGGKRSRREFCVARTVRNDSRRLFCVPGTFRNVSGRPGNEHDQDGNHSRRLRSVSRRDGSPAVGGLELSGEVYLAIDLLYRQPPRGRTSGTPNRPLLTSPLLQPSPAQGGRNPPPAPRDPPHPPAPPPAVHTHTVQSTVAPGRFERPQHLASEVLPEGGAPLLTSPTQVNAYAVTPARRAAARGWTPSAP